MRSRAVAALTAGAFLMVAGQAASAEPAEVVISINKAAQSMSVLVDGIEQHRWVVSTGLGGGPHDGSYKAGRMERKWFSRKYNMAPMPHSIFFDGNYAIHGTYHIKQLGRRASKGCVRLHPDNAAKLFELVRANHGSTTVVVSSTTHVAARMPPVEAAPVVPVAAASAEPPAPVALTPAVAAATEIAKAESGSPPAGEPATVRVPIPEQQAADVAPGASGPR